MLHDPATYPDPEEFRPSRFLTSDGVLDPAVPDPEVTFGFGRHLCPVSHCPLLYPQIVKTELKVL